MLLQLLRFRHRRRRESPDIICILELCEEGSASFSSNPHPSLAMLPCFVYTIYIYGAYINLYVCVWVCVCIYIYIHFLHATVCVWAGGLSFMYTSVHSCTLDRLCSSVCVCVCVRSRVSGHFTATARPAHPLHNNAKRLCISTNPT